VWFYPSRRKTIASTRPVKAGLYEAAETQIPPTGLAGRTTEHRTGSSTGCERSGRAAHTGGVHLGKNANYENGGVDNSSSKRGKYANV
jgi:hypothetical protein